MEIAKDSNIPLESGELDPSPVGYGLVAENVPEGFVAVGTDNDTWITRFTGESGLEWVKTADIQEVFMQKDGTPITTEYGTLKDSRRLKTRKESIVLESLRYRLKKRKGSAKGSKRANLKKTGSISVQSGLLWMGDPICLYNYASSHGFDQFLSKFSGTRSGHVILKGIAWNVRNPDKQKPVYINRDQISDRLSPQGICVLME